MTFEPRFLACKLLIALTFLLGIQLASPVQVAGQQPITIGMAGENFSFIPFRIAQERGFYKKHGLNVQHVRIPGANVAISALVSGSLDYGTHYQVTMLWGAKGLGTRAILSTAVLSEKLVFLKYCLSLRRHSSEGGTGYPDDHPALLHRQWFVHALLRVTHKRLGW